MNKLYFKLKDDIKEYGLVFQSEDKNKIDAFKNVCRQKLDKNLNWFHQSNGESFQFFEFWSSNMELMLNESLKIAKEMNLTLEVNSTFI